MCDQKGKNKLKEVVFKQRQYVQSLKGLTVPGVSGKQKEAVPSGAVSQGYEKEMSRQAENALQARPCI